MSAVWWDQKYRAEIEKRLVELSDSNKRLREELNKVLSENEELRRTIEIYKTEDRL